MPDVTELFAGDVQKVERIATKNGNPLNALRWTIDSTLELAPDQFEVTTDDPADYADSAPTDRVTLKVGFISAAGNPVVVGQIVDGVVTEYGRQVGKDSVKIRLKGRDQMVYAKRTFQKRYLRTAPTEPVSGTPSPIPFVVGVFTARHIAEEAAAFLNLPLSWQAPDYELQADYEANGRVLDVIQALADPFGKPEPFRVDVYMSGTTIIVKQREIAPLAPPDTVMSVKDARIRDWSDRKGEPLKFGKVRLEGANVDGQDSQNPGNTPSLSLEPFGSTTYGEGGEITATVFGSILYRLPERLALRTVSTTFSGAGIASQSTQDSLWVDDKGILILDERVAVGTPRLANETKSIESDDKGLLVETEREEKSYAYDVRRQMTVETTVKYRRDKKTNSLVPSERSVRTLADASRGMVKETADRYSVKKSTGALSLSMTETRIQGGFRPGGTGGGGGLGNATGTPVVLEETLSTDVDAVDVTEHFPQLRLDDLKRIMAQYKAAQGRRPVEIQYVGRGMPWLLRGAIIGFTGLKGPDNVDLPVQPAIVASLKITLDESVKNPYYETAVSGAVSWV